MPITVFSSPDCHWSRRATDLLRNCGCEFVEKDVSSDPAAGAEMVRVSGQRGVPVTVADDEVIVGYDEPRLQRLCPGRGGIRGRLRGRGSMRGRLGCSLGCLPSIGLALSAAAGAALGVRQAAMQPARVPDPPAIVIPVARAAAAAPVKAGPAAASPGSGAAAAAPAPSKAGSSAPAPAGSSAAATVPSPSASPSPVETPFVPFWVRNHRVTELWTGPESDPNARAIGVTSEQFCIFHVEQRPDDRRRFVFNPYSGEYQWIDSFAVGPVGTPVPVARPKPAGQNCAIEVYAS